MDDKIINWAVLKSAEQCKIKGWKDIAVNEIQTFAKLLAKEIDRRTSEVSQAALSPLLPTLSARFFWISSGRNEVQRHAHTRVAYESE